MGLEYYAINEKTREAYELGKGNWQECFSSRYSLPQPGAIEVMMVQGLWNVDNTYAYAQTIYEALVQLVSSDSYLKIVTDSEVSDTSQYDDVVVVSSRYKSCTHSFWLKTGKDVDRPVPHYPICNVQSALSLTIICGTNEHNEVQKPIYTVKNNSDLVVETTDAVYALQALLNRIT